MILFSSFRISKNEYDLYATIVIEIFKKEDKREYFQVIGGNFQGHLYSAYRYYTSLYVESQIRTKRERESTAGAYNYLIFILPSFNNLILLF
jgi:hypothetical protein